MVSVLFSGCSFVQGCGLENEHKNPGHFSNLLTTNLFGTDHTIENIGVVGHSNERIFLDSALALIKKNIIMCLCVGLLCTDMFSGQD